MIRLGKPAGLSEGGPPHVGYRVLAQRVLDCVEGLFRRAVGKRFWPSDSTSERTLRRLGEVLGNRRDGPAKWTHSPVRVPSEHLIDHAAVEVHRPGICREVTGGLPRPPTSEKRGAAGLTDSLRSAQV